MQTLLTIHPGLAALLYPKSSGDFLRHFESNEPFVTQMDPSAIRPLLELPFLQSLEALLGVWPHPVQAHLPKIADEASAIEVPPEGARKLFENGMALLFDDVERISPVLPVWLDAIREELSFPEMTKGRCLVYATPHGKGTAPHFDQNVNFVLQIHGTKKWWLAANEHVENPLSRHTMGLQADPELESYANGPLPTKMPKDNQAVVLQPATLLYVPRGMWHSTEAAGDALSLNFTYTVPSWLDVFTAALRSRLALSPEWRDLVRGVSSADPASRELAERKFDLLLSELTQDLPNWRASEILSVL